MDLARDGYTVLRGQVPLPLIADALRLIHRHQLTVGLTPAAIEEYLDAACWFPELRDRDEIVALRDVLPSEFRGGTPCEPQILVHYPDDPCATYDLLPHLDREPQWAGERKYARIVGVALTEQTEQNGCLHVWPLSGGGPIPVEMEPGDAIVFSPLLMHTSATNTSGCPRWAVYFRFLSS